jgi:hypothetical protein
MFVRLDFTLTERDQAVPGSSVEGGVLIVNHQH